MAPEITLRSVEAVIVLANDGSRLFAHYYADPQASARPFATEKAQKAFEKNLFDKTAKQNNDTLLYDNHVVLYKAEADVILYLVASPDENEILLYNVLLALRDALYMLLKQSIDKRTLFENYDLLALTVDELVDDGIILETDPSVIVQRVTRMPTVEATARIDLSEQGVNNLAQLGRAKLVDWLRQGL